MSTSLPRLPFGPFSPVRQLRFGDERFQDVPGWPEYPAYTVDVVSCELPSGAAWFFSCLLELRIPAWKPWNAETGLEWTSRGDHRYRYWCPGNPWRRLAPGLVSDREFVFRSGPVPRYTHAWPGAQPPCPRTILVVRDPRDALYSAWRREEASLGLDGGSPDRFIAYANAPCAEQHYRRADYWDRFHAAWLEDSADKPCLTIRFEDFKRDALGVLENMCTFLDLPASAQEMATAVAASDFGNVLRIDQGMVSKGVFNWTVNRAGTANEFVTTYTPEMRSVFSKGAMAIWQRLGYDPSA